MVEDDRFTELNSRTCVVLGGRGFLGRSLVLRLLKIGKWIVRVADFPHSLELDPSERGSLLSEALSSGRASYFHVDVRVKAHIVQALQGASVVFYMDSSDLNTVDFYSCYMTIVQGVRNVIGACRECRVRRLIYNSSADVVFDGSCDVHNADESFTCPWKIENIMSDLKAQAEALILVANDIDGLLTCAIRPCNVFGPGDTEFLPLLLKLANHGWTKFIIGNGENMSDFTYSENVTHAHICAEEALDLRMVSVAGKAFLITNLQPVNFWDFVSLILEGLGYQRPFVKLPAKMVWYIMLLFRWMHESLGSRNFSYPLLTHYFHIASHTKTFNCTAAQKDIGYSPVVSLEEGLTLTIESSSHLAIDLSLARYIDYTKQSKADMLLGGGKVADILLWRDERTTFAYFLASVALFYWFFLSGRTFMSSAAWLLLLFITALYGYGILPPNTFGFAEEKVSFPNFTMTDTVVKDLLRSVVYQWNKGVRKIRMLARGEDWSTFFKVAVPLYFLRLILSQPFTLMVATALVFAFTTFFLYEQYESEIDGMVKVLFSMLKEGVSLLARNLPYSVLSYLQNDDRSQGGIGQTRVMDLR